ncbi:tripartite ATP-independent transporter DctM subunit [Pacificibacter maritimus]|uniref:Tripartite ATP-independent transporter DctM subunit n=1 Tax=Pacificibacter maritimus TaxID=762213 RepID=A0A3N4VCM9_9RHOB|nr:TRAP transporter large permease subunit [Pacificibacter maritimus]RPE71590.1 tripartite ATP-independent transporter DctM subunit [Pacificibacter maritimus]
MFASSQSVPVVAQRARRVTGVISILAIASVLLGAMTIVVDVLMRWLLGQSIFALNEILSIVFAIAVAATIPAGAAYNVNLRLDLLAHLTSPRVNAWLNVISAVSLLVFFGVIGVSAWGIGLQKVAQGSFTMLLRLPLHPVYFAVALAMFAGALVQITAIYVAVQQARAIGREGRKTHLAVIALLTILAVSMGMLSFLMATNMGAVTNFVLLHPSAAVLCGFALLWLGVFAQLPLATVTAGLGVVGAMPVVGGAASVDTMTSEAITFLLNPQVATLPLFLIMGAFAVISGISSDLFRLGDALLGRFRGGLAYATVAACAGFGAVSGNSLVTSATFGRMALPEMKKLGYAPTLSTATVAAGGTLGALVPPSGVIILFALLTQESIGALFIAALLPAILALVLYFAVIFCIVTLNAEAAPKSAGASGREIWDAVVTALPVMGLFAIVIGGLYGGLFTVTESAAVGAVAAFALALFRGRLTRASLLSVFGETTTTVAMIYALVFGGLIFAFSVNLTGAPDLVAGWIASIDARPVVILMVLICIYLLLGSVMDSFAVMIITLPVVTPIILDLGYDMLFWGVLMLVVVETGMITPPFGMNLFILKSIDPEEGLGTVMRGVLPFVIADFVKIVILVAFPVLSLWLPSTMN